MKVKHMAWNAPIARWVLILILSGVLLASLFYQAAAAANPQTVDDGRAIFDLKCKACHTVGGGDLVGPDLDGVTERRDLAWLTRFIHEPDVVIAEGDPIATELLAKYNNVAMPNLALSEPEVESLLAYFNSGEINAPVAVDLPPGDNRRGEALFTGGHSLQNGGTPCMSCHSVGGVGALGGGNLGPDLTKVYSRFGEAGLGSSLQNIAFPTMLNVYINKPLTDQEVADLVTFFQQADDTQKAGTAQQSTSAFWIAGGVGTLLLFGVMAIFWPRQRESLSDRLRKNAEITARRDS